MSELLKVLDMSEDAQISWIRKNVSSGQSLANLAFRLRDETTMPGLAVACEQVFHCAKKFHGKPDVSATPKTWMWFVCCAKPIHWIIAALIAKECKK